MNLEKIIRFGFASRRRKLLTLTLAGVAGIGALAGGGEVEDQPSETTQTTVATVKPTTTTTVVGNPDVYARIATLTDCSELQEQFDLAEKTSKRSGGTQLMGTWSQIGISYMKAADARMKAVGCYGDVEYRNCDEVRDADKAPLRRGDPGYSSKLDRDGDGVACDK